MIDYGNIMKEEFWRQCIRKGMGKLPDLNVQTVFGEYVQHSVTQGDANTSPIFPEIVNIIPLPSCFDDHVV